jgi:5-methylthioribose kinase
MEYQILNKSNIQEYLYTIDSIKEYFGGANLSVDEIGDGNLNYVFIIKSQSDESKALILKQAVPYLRCVGEEYPLSKERMTYEIRALTNFHDITQEHIPKLYDTNENMSTVIMQFLDEHIIMRQGMIEGKIYPHFTEHISTYLAQNLFKTSSLHLSSKNKRELVDQFNTNTELCKLTEDFVFTFAFMDHETNDEYAKNHPIAQALYDDMVFKKEVLKLKYKFMTQNDALIHGDLHTGSIMLNEEQTFIIDPEFAFVGPFGFDIGALIGNLTMSYVSHVALNTNVEYQEWILDTIENILSQFEMKFLSLWKEHNESALLFPNFIKQTQLQSFKEEFMLQILRDSVGFAGCKMARRMFGIAGVADIREIEDKAIKDKAIGMTLDIAKTFVKNNTKIENIQEVMNIIKDKTQ